MKKYILAVLTVGGLLFAFIFIKGKADIASRKERIDSLNSIRLELFHRKLLQSAKHRQSFFSDNNESVISDTDTIPKPKRNENFMRLPDTLLLKRYDLEIKSIYGADSREDISCLGIATRKDFMDSRIPYIVSARKVCALIPKKLLTKRTDGFYELTSGTLGETKFKNIKPCATANDVCFNNQVSNETIKYTNQLAGAWCSGFGYQKNQIITATHCFEEGKQITDFYYVFGFVYYPGKPYQLIPADDVYTIEKAIKISTLRGFAILQTDRPLQAWQKAEIDKNDLNDGEKIYMVGHPDGLPMKLTLDAKVKSPDNQSLTFRTDLDAFHGNSGAPVFNTREKVIGILLKGDIDYEITDENCKKYFKSPGGYNELVLRALFIR